MLDCALPGCALLACVLPIPAVPELGLAGFAPVTVSRDVRNTRSRSVDVVEPVAPELTFRFVALWAADDALGFVGAAPLPRDALRAFAALPAPLPLEPRELVARPELAAPRAFPLLAPPLL